VLAVCPEFLIEDYNKTDMIIYLKNGSQIRAVSAENPERLRGLNTSWVWVDELAAIQRDEDCWNMMMFGLRLGKSPRIIVTTTPKPRDLLIKIIETPTTVVDRASTYANIDNLSPTFREQILQYEQTKLGRQEIHAEILDAEEGGVVKREWIKLWPNHKPFPEELQFVITSYDCAYGEKQTNDYTACTTWGIFQPLDGPLAVLLLDCWQERLSFPDLKPRVLDEWETSYGSGKKQKRCDLIVIEEKAAGISLLQELRRMHLPVVGWNPGRADKLQRLHIAATVIAAGRVWMPESGNRKGFVRDWAEPLVSQMCSFPQCSHDDLMDAAVQALRYLKDTGWLEINRAPKEDDWDDTYDLMKTRGNPYAQ
jgi:hypothetical protein